MPYSIHNLFFNPEPIGIANPTFKVIIAYDGFRPLLRARGLRQNLAAQFKNEVLLTGETWNFALLANEQLREEAARQAAEADMIVIAINDPGDLPAHIQTWIESWAEQRSGGAAALVALFDPEPSEPGGSSPTADFLGTIAARAGMDYFSNREIPGLAVREPARRASEKAPWKPENIIPQDFTWRGWGIND